MGIQNQLYGMSCISGEYFPYITYYQTCILLYKAVLHILLLFKTFFASNMTSEKRIGALQNGGHLIQEPKYSYAKYKFINGHCCQSNISNPYF